MNKLIFLALLLSVSCLLGRSQKTTPNLKGEETNKADAPGASGVSFSTFGSGGNKNTAAAANSKTCTVKFLVKGKVVYTEQLDAKKSEAHRSSFNSQASNKIDEIDYECAKYCWIVLFADNKWEGNSIGFWTPKYEDTIELSDYMSYNQKKNSWEHWDSVGSSYSVYCYF